MKAARKRRLEFWEWAFESSGSNPLSWQASAKDLLEGAAAVKSRVVPDPTGNSMHSLAVVQALLLGFALECLLKGMWIKTHKAWLEKNTPFSLTRNGRYVGIPGAGDHELKQLAVAAKVKVSPSERAVLERLSGFVKFAGRYPVATASEQMKPKKMPGGKKVTPTFITTPELELAEALASRLMEDVEPWR